MTKYSFALFVVVFVYGILVGSRQYFPFEEIRYLKNTLLPSSINLEEVPESYTLTLDLYKSYDNNLKSAYVVIGDSLMNGCDWNELLGQSDIINRAINGDTSYGVYKRRESAYIKSTKFALIMMGVNDITRYQNINEIYERYIKMLIFLKAKNIEPIIHSVLYLNDLVENYEYYNAEIEKFNALINTYSLDNNLKFIDLNKALSSDKQLRKVYTYDGQHLNTKGYLVWKKILQEKVFNEKPFL